jgi:hypothetical protein
MIILLRIGCFRVYTVDEPGRRVGQRRDATRAPTPGPDHSIPTEDEQVLILGFVLDGLARCVKSREREGSALALV